MGVFSTIVFFEEKQPMYHLHFAEVAMAVSTNDTWVSNCAFISMPNTLKFFIKKEKKRKTRELQKFSLLSGAYDVLG